MNFIQRIIIMLVALAPTTTFAKVFTPAVAKLDNGLQIILVENHLAPVVSISLAYKVGTADDPEDMVGLSHFLEHLMFKGTKKVPAGEFKMKIISKGGSINAFTTPDVTCYTCDIAVENLPLVLEIEADRMQNIVFDEKETKSEQKVVMEERRMRYDNNPLGPAYESVLRALFKYHPYSVPTIGYPYHIEAYTNDAAREHYKKWYAPNNAILVVSGDITMEDLLPLVKKYFAEIPSRPLPVRSRHQDPKNDAVLQHMDIPSPRVSFESYDWYYKAPCHTSEGKEHFYPIILLVQILGGNENSRLYKDLVDKRQLALGATLGYDDDSIDPKHLEISATLHPSKKMAELKEAIDAHVKSVLEKGVTEEELKTAKRDILAGLAFARDGNSGAINAFRRVALGFTVEDVESWPDLINAVTVDQVNAAAKAVLGKGPVVTNHVMPAK